MADQLMTIEMDVTRVLAAFAKLGPAAAAACLSASYQTALAVKAQAQINIPKRRPFTVNHIITARSRSIDGYVVMMDDVVKDKEKARRRSLGMKSARATYHQEKHVGLWLERGTSGLHAQPPRRWLMPAGESQERAHLYRLGESLDRAVQEADV